jgi:hypothetical protein
MLVRNNCTRVISCGEGGMDIALVTLFVCRDEFLSLDSSVLMVVSKTCNSGFEKKMTDENSTKRKFWEEFIIPAVL